MNEAKASNNTRPSMRLIILPEIDHRLKPSTHRMISSTDARTVKGMSLVTVVREMLMGATIAVTPTMSSVFIVLLPTTLPTARSGVPFRAEATLTKSSGADVPAATIVSPITISEMFIRRASEDAPSVRRSAPHSTSVMPTMIKTISSIISLITYHLTLNTSHFSLHTPHFTLLNTQRYR